MQSAPIAMNKELGAQLHSSPLGAPNTQPLCSTLLYMSKSTNVILAQHAILRAMDHERGTKINNNKISQ